MIVPEIRDNFWNVYFIVGQSSFFTTSVSLEFVDCNFLFICLFGRVIWKADGRL